MNLVDTIARVWRDFHIHGSSVKTIVRKLHVSPNTVRNILRSGETDFSDERERQPVLRLGRREDRLEQMLGSNGGQTVPRTFDADPDIRRTSGARIRRRL